MLLSSPVFFNLLRFTAPFRPLKKFDGTPYLVKNDNLAVPDVVKHQEKGINSKFGGTPDTSLRHPSVSLHPGWKSLIYSNLNGHRGWFPYNVCVVNLRLNFPVKMFFFEEKTEKGKKIVMLRLKDLLADLNSLFFSSSISPSPQWFLSVSTLTHTLCTN